jgi:hypothetical protein
VTHPDIRQKFIVIDPLIEEKYENTYLLGILAGYLGLEASVFESAVERAFAKK